MFDKVFFKMRLIPTEDGLKIWTDTFLAIHETSCYCFAIPEFARCFFTPALTLENETPYQYARRTKRKIHRISKENSRFAFETKEGAFQHLMFLKRKQLQHMKRDMSFIERFLTDAKGKQFDDFRDDKGWIDGAVGIPSKTLPGTKNLVHEHLVFE